MIFKKSFLVASGGLAKGDLTPLVGKGGSLVVIDRKPSLWLLVWNVGGAIALYWRVLTPMVVRVHDTKTHLWHIIVSR